MPPSRRLANTIGRWSFSWAVGADIPDNQSGYRLVSRRLMQALLEFNEQGFEYEVEMIAICVRRGYSLPGCPSAPSTPAKPATSARCSTSATTCVYYGRCGENDYRRSIILLLTFG